MHVDWHYSQRYLRSTRGAATFLAQNLLIVACSLCSSSYELNGLHGNIPSALQPRPITAILLRPYSRAPSRRYSFGLTAAPNHGDIPSALQPRPITAIIDFSLPQGKSRFHSASSPRSRFLDCRAVDFVIAAKSILSSPRSRFCHRREVDF